MMLSKASALEVATCRSGNKGTRRWFSRIKLTSPASMSQNQARRMDYIVHLMIQFNADHQKLRMRSRNDDHIHKWLESHGEADYKLRDDFFRIQSDIVTIIMKEVVDEKGMFHHGPISRADVRTRIGMQRLDLTPFKKLGFVLDDMEGWNF